MYLDANFFVFSRYDTTAKGENARDLLTEIIKGKKDALTTALTLDEVMWALIKNGHRKDVHEVIEEIYSVSHLVIREVPALLPLAAIDLMEQFNLRPRDAFHLAAMQLFGIKEIVSDDSDFDKIKEIKRVKI